MCYTGTGGMWGICDRIVKNMILNKCLCNYKFTVINAATSTPVVPFTSSAGLQLATLDCHVGKLRILDEDSAEYSTVFFFFRHLVACGSHSVSLCYVRSVGWMFYTYSGLPSKKKHYRLCITLYRVAVWNSVFAKVLVGR